MWMRENICSLFLIFPENCWKSVLFNAGSNSGNFLVSIGFLRMEVVWSPAGSIVGVIAAWEFLPEKVQ